MITSLAQVISNVQDAANNDVEAVAVLTVLLGAGRIREAPRHRPRIKRRAA